MTAIFDLPLTPISDIIHTGPAVMLEQLNVDVAFWISLMTYRSWDIALFHSYFRFLAAIFDFRLPRKCRSGFEILVRIFYRSYICCNVLRLMFIVQFYLSVFIIIKFKSVSAKVLYIVLLSYKMLILYWFPTENM